MFEKCVLLWNTLKYLRIGQVIYRVKYFIRAKTNKGFVQSFFQKIENKELCRQIFFEQFKSYKGISLDGERFKFLNQEVSFESGIDWNYSGNGKLWTYNLNYFNYLFDEGLTEENGLRLISDFISKTKELKDGLEPYPTSLRGVNWVKYFCEHQNATPEINGHLYHQYELLSKSLEYHILGNHLLENGYSLLFGGVYFDEPKFYDLGKSIVKSELNEEILKDGGHFELSPMYHQILVEKLLDCIQLIKKNKGDKSFISFLEEKARVMIGWLEQMTFVNGDIPLLNDSATGIAWSTEELVQYAKSLDINSKPVALNECGYRAFNNDRFEMRCDVGQVGPTYQPGHAHADTFSFVLNVDSKPFIIDPGISTYEKNAKRQEERSTSMHNTLEIGGRNSSRVWGGFRVAERAKVRVLEESGNRVKATHDGYKALGVEHTREFDCGEKCIEIKDWAKSKYETVGSLHFAPSVNVELVDDKVVFDQGEIVLDGAFDLSVTNYDCPNGYNRYIEAQKLTYKVKSESILVVNLY